MNITMWRHCVTGVLLGSLIFGLGFYAAKSGGGYVCQHRKHLIPSDPPAQLYRVTTP